jgi:hypothetical protein
MNRIPVIAAAIAVFALLLAGYLALSSRIARLEEASTGLRDLPVSGGLDEFAALRYDGAGDLRLTLSRRLATLPHPSPFAEAAVPVESAAPARTEAARPPAPAVEVAKVVEEPPAATPPPKAAPAPPAAGTAPVVQAAPKPGWLAQLKDLVGFDEPSAAEIEAGIREALNTGADAAIAQLSAPGGFADDPEVAIPLPQKLEAVRTVLKGVGMAALMDDLRARLNRAAELGAPDAREPLRQAIADLPIDDPLRLHDRDDAATAYLRSRMRGRLEGQLRPLIYVRLNEVGAQAVYNQAIGIYNSLPFVPPIEGDLASYVASRSLDGIFLRLKAEERQIRTDPERRTTVALRAAFGGSVE